MKNYVCEKCGSLDLFIKSNGSQTGLYCSDCGKWIKWVSKSELPLVEKFIKDNKKTVETITTNYTIMKSTMPPLDDLFSKWSADVNPYAFEEEIVERFIEWMKNQTK